MRAVSTGTGRSLIPARHTKWPLVLLSLLMSLLSLLSKEQGVTVVGVCAAFDIFLNWENILRRLWRRKTDSSEVVLSEKTIDTELPAQQTRVTRASARANGRYSTVNGLSLTSAAQRKPKIFNDRFKLQTLALRIGEILILTCFKMFLSLSLYLSVSPGNWSGAGVVQNVHELWLKSSLQTLRDAGSFSPRQICQASLISIYLPESGI